jgi:hypothetical protein
MLCRGKCMEYWHCLELNRLVLGSIINQCNHIQVTGGRGGFAMGKPWSILQQTVSWHLTIVLHLNYSYILVLTQAHPFFFFQKTHDPVVKAIFPLIGPHLWFTRQSTPQRESFNNTMFKFWQDSRGYSQSKISSCSPFLIKQRNVIWTSPRTTAPPCRIVQRSSKATKQTISSTELLIDCSSIHLPACPRGLV